MTDTAPPLIVFTDLDGTLLDHRSYSFAPARAALDRLAALGIPLVLASSKTAAEIAVLRDEIGRGDCPAIVENGAGILDPGSAPEGDAEVYARLRAALDDVPSALRQAFTGFGDMGPAGVEAATGLAPEAAARAATRRFSEPGVWDGSDADLQVFQDTLAQNGVATRRGGRFLTLSFGGTKADRIAEIAARYGSPPRVAAGDAPNDIEMLAVADYGIIVANPHGAPLPLQPGEVEGRVQRTLDPGPAGWNGAMLDLLDRLDLN